MFPLETDGHGGDRAGTGHVAIYGIPYLEPRLVAERLGAENANHFDVTLAAVERIRRDVESAAHQDPCIR